MKPPVIYLFVQHTCPEYPKIAPNSVYFATFSNIDVVYELTDTYVLGDTLAITALQTKVTTGRLLLIRIEDHKEQICCLSRCAWLVWVLRVFSMVQRVPTAGRCPTILFCIVTRSLACFCRALGCLVKSSQRWHYLLSSAPVPSYNMLGNFSDNSRTQRIAQHAHQITEAATLIKQLRKRPCSEAWGTCKRPWGVAGTLGCLQCRSYAPTSCTLSMFQSLSMLLPVLLKNLVGKESNDQWQEKALASSFTACLHELSRWPQHYEDDSTSRSVQTLAFAMIWNCWKRAPLLQCSDTVCLSSIKTSKIPETSETCTTCKSLRGLTFLDPGPRWNHRSSTYLSNTLALNIPK